MWGVLGTDMIHNDNVVNGEWMKVTCEDDDDDKNRWMEWKRRLTEPNDNHLSVH